MILTQICRFATLSDTTKMFCLKGKYNLDSDDELVQTITTTQIYFIALLIARTSPFGDIKMTCCSISVMDMCTKVCLFLFLFLKTQDSGRVNQTITA